MPGHRVCAGGTLRPTPTPRSPLQGEALSPCSTTRPCTLPLSFLQISFRGGRTRAWEGWFLRLGPALIPWGLLPFPQWSLVHPGHQCLVPRGQWQRTYRTFPLSQYRLLTGLQAQQITHPQVPANGPAVLSMRLTAAVALASPSAPPRLVHVNGTVTAYCMLKCVPAVGWVSYRCDPHNQPWR